MRVIIGGSRSITDYAALDGIMSTLVSKGLVVTEVVSGTARGVDLLGERWARQHNLPIRRFPADWDLYGYTAGPIRNKVIAEYADYAVILWDGHSKGAYNMFVTMAAVHRPNAVVTFCTQTPQGWRCIP